MALTNTHQVRAQNGLARPMQELRAKTQARDENQARIDSKIQAKEAAKLLEAERRAAENAEKEKAAAAADAAKEAGGEDEDEDEDDLFGENEDDENENEDGRENAQPPQEANETADQTQVSRAGTGSMSRLANVCLA
jgi:membrane protein involved in colicin uptake